MTAIEHTQKPTALIMAGGTGGHVMPALAVANALIAKGYNVHWLGTKHGLEARVVPQEGFPVSYINIKGLRGKGWRSLLTAPFKIFWAICQALKIILKVKPFVALSMGA